MSSVKYDFHEGTNQQSLRESSYETHRRLSQQSIGQSQVESAINNFMEPDQSGDKYVQDSFETEKPKTSRPSLNIEEDQFQPRETRRKGSIRFYDEVQSLEGKKGIETSPEYKREEYGLEKNLQHPIQQEYTDPIGYDQSDRIFKTGQYDYPQNYDSSQYVDQKNYEDNHYGLDGSANEYEYQYAQSTYNSNELPIDVLYQPEQYIDGQKLQEIASARSTLELEKPQLTQQQQTFTHLPTSNSEMERRYKGYENSTALNKQPVLKSPLTKNLI